MAILFSLFCDTDFISKKEMQHYNSNGAFITQSCFELYTDRIVS